MDEMTTQPRDIAVVTAEIQLYKQQAGASLLEIGRRLTEAKDLLGHGQWLPWLTEKVEFSEATAQRFMRLAREYVNPSALTDLGPSKALLLLALPEDERAEFAAEKHEVDGETKTVAEMSTRELTRAIAERDNAKKLAEELSDKLRAAQAAAEKDKLSAAQAAQADKKSYADDLAAKKKDVAAAQDSEQAQKQRAETLAARVKELEDAAAAPIMAEMVPDEETLARIRDEVAAEQAEAVRAAQAASAEFERKYQAAKNPEAAQINFMFGEMQTLHARILRTLAQMDGAQHETADKLRGAIGAQLRAWGTGIAGEDASAE